MDCTYVTKVLKYVKEMKYLDTSCFDDINTIVGLYWETNNTCTR